MPNVNRSNCTKKTCSVATSVPQKVICLAQHWKLWFVQCFQLEHPACRGVSRPPESFPPKPAGFFLPRPSVFLSTALDIQKNWQSLAQIKNHVTFSKPQDALDKLTLLNMQNVKTWPSFRLTIRKILGTRELRRRGALDSLGSLGLGSWAAVLAKAKLRCNLRSGCKTPKPVVKKTKRKERKDRNSRI